MVAVHIDGQVNHLHVQAGDDLAQDLVVECVLGCELEALHMLKGHLLVLCLFNVLDLALDTFEDASREPLNQNLNHTRSMNVQRNANQVVADLVDEGVESVGVGNLHDPLAKVVSKLIHHHIGGNRKHEVNQTLQEGFPLRRLWHATIVSIMDHLLKLSAPSLVKAVEVESI